ncbi:MAG: lipid IV(A) 3-deoxy-D-manno-octulosonic acid transferase, partial [Desulfohalobiaceae bacterium]
MLSQSFLLQAYNALGHLALPAILARLALKGWKSPEYYQRVGERLGLGGHGSQAGSIWVHAVSVGEIQAASALLQKLLLKYPRPGILLTTTTPTGSKLAQEKFADQVSHCYLPYDLPWAARKFLEARSPQLALFMETEIWPNMFAQCHKKGIPLMLLNARISRASWRGYSKVKPLIQVSLNSCRRILAQSKNDAHRLKDLGAVSDRVLVSGNLKFDVNVPQEQLQSGRQLRQENWPDRPVWIAASTHAGEEEKILQAQAEIASCLPGSLLILVPRHPQRFDQVHELCRRQGFAVCRRSKHDQQAGNCSVYLADSLGELFTLYAAADVAFVGGSLVDKGGHNLLEPAAIGLPLL